MNPETLTNLLSQVAQGSMSVAEATTQFKDLSFEDIDFANIDHHRSLRKGFPEVIFGQGKTSLQIIGILERMVAQEDIILVTRIDEKKAKDVQKVLPVAEYFQDARLLRIQKRAPAATGFGRVLIISAGTSDIPVAREAALTAQAMGNEVDTLFDVGVAGIHRSDDHGCLEVHAGGLRDDQVAVGDIRGGELLDSGCARLDREGHHTTRIARTVAGLDEGAAVARQRNFLPCNRVATGLLQGDGDG